MFDVFYTALDLSALASYLAPVLACFVILGVIALVRRCFK